MKYIMGIDPGLSGGIAVLDETGRVVGLVKMPDTVHDLWALINGGWVNDRCECRAYIEKLGHMPRDKQGKAMQSGTSMFKMGTNYGSLQMALAAAWIPYIEVSPRTWQSAYGLLRTDKNETTTAKKNRHKAEAQRRYPGEKITHAVADALLIADYGRSVQ